MANGRKPAKSRARAAGSKPVGASRQSRPAAPRRAAKRGKPAQAAVVAAAEAPAPASVQPSGQAAVPDSRPQDAPSHAPVPAEPATAAVDAAAPQPAPDAIIHLGAQLTIREAVALRAELLERVDLVDAVGLDASGVQKVDTAGLQVLLAFRRQRQAAFAPTVWTGCSEAVRKGAQGLDLAGALGLPAGAAS